MCVYIKKQSTKSSTHLIYKYLSMKQEEFARLTCTCTMETNSVQLFIIKAQFLFHCSTDYCLTQHSSTIKNYISQYIRHTLTRRQAQVLVSYLGEVIYQSEQPFLQLPTFQVRQLVGVLQLIPVVLRQQVRVKPYHMGGICNRQQTPRYTCVTTVTFLRLSYTICSSDQTETDMIKKRAESSSFNKLNTDIFPKPFASKNSTLNNQHQSNELCLSCLIEGHTTSTKL